MDHQISWEKVSFLIRVHNFYFQSCTHKWSQYLKNSLKKIYWFFCRNPVKAEPYPKIGRFSRSLIDPPTNDSNETFRKTLLLLTFGNRHYYLKRPIIGLGRSLSWPCFFQRTSIHGRIDNRSWRRKSIFPKVSASSDCCHCDVRRRLGYAGKKYGHAQLILLWDWC